MRANVKKFLPVLRRQIKEHGYAKIRQCLVTGDTKFLSGKDRREALSILDAENLGWPEIEAAFKNNVDFKQEYMGSFDIKGE